MVKHPRVRDRFKTTKTAKTIVKVADHEASQSQSKIEKGGKKG